MSSVMICFDSFFLCGHFIKSVRLQKFKEVHARRGGSDDENNGQGIEEGAVDEKSVEEKKRQKQKIAETKRSKAMEQMARLQKQFIKVP